MIESNQINLHRNIEMLAKFWAQVTERTSPNHATDTLEATSQYDLPFDAQCD